MSDAAGRDGDVGLGLIVVAVICGFVFMIYKVLTAPKFEHAPPAIPTVQTTCHNGQVWTSHYFKGSQRPDNMILVNGQPVDCKES